MINVLQNILAQGDISNWLTSIFFPPPHLVWLLVYFKAELLGWVLPFDLTRVDATTQQMVFQMFSPSFVVSIMFSNGCFSASYPFRATVTALPSIPSVMVIRPFRCIRLTIRSSLAGVRLYPSKRWVAGIHRG